MTFITYILTFAFGILLRNPIAKLMSKFVPFLSMLEIKYSLWTDRIKCYYCGKNAWTIDDAFHDQKCSQLFCSICTQDNKGHTRRVCCDGHKVQRERDWQKQLKLKKKW
jgi:hypothetical protein